jgi:hypothetical protein
MLLRFEFRVLNDEGEVIVSDWTTFTPYAIDVNGAVATVDMHTGAALRFVRRQDIAGKLESEAA